MQCPQCGWESPEGLSFCGNCGAALAVAAGPREVRKVVTVVFCDLTGSTVLGDTTDPETVRATMRSYYDAMRTILERRDSPRLREERAQPGLAPCLAQECRRRERDEIRGRASEGQDQSGRGRDMSRCRNDSDEDVDCEGE